MTEDELAHSGVLGMKWGHRKSANGSQIRTARRNLSKQLDDIDTQRGIAKAAGKGTRKRTAENNKLDTMKVSFLKNPDRVIAARMTRGEKIAALIITAPTYGTVGAAAIAGTSAASRRIELKQQTGQYNKKK
jgi:hypothetical protein